MAVSDLFIRYRSLSPRISDACTVPSYRIRPLPSPANGFRVWRNSHGEMEPESPHRWIISRRDLPRMPNHANETG